MFVVNFYAFTGCSPSPREYIDQLDARSDVARVLRRARRTGHIVTVHDRGHRWELTEPDGCAMIPDTAGELYLTAHLFPCNECGCEYETVAAARRCCDLDREYGPDRIFEGAVS